MSRVLVVLQHLLDVDRALAPRAQGEAKPLRAQIPIDEDPHDRVGRCWFRIDLAEREEQAPSRCADLERFSPVVDLYPADPHKYPSDCSARISWRTSVDAAPFIALRLSRSHFTMSLPSR